MKRNQIDIKEAYRQYQEGKEVVCEFPNLTLKIAKGHADPEALDLKRILEANTLWLEIGPKRSSLESSCNEVAALMAGVAKTDLPGYIAAIQHLTNAIIDRANKEMCERLANIIEGGQRRC